SATFQFYSAEVRMLTSLSQDWINLNDPPAVGKKMVSIYFSLSLLFTPRRFYKKPSTWILFTILGLLTGASLGYTLFITD
ncbi:hypothetical protein ACJX0J_039651, partial [Zea mays]